MDRALGFIPLKEALTFLKETLAIARIWKKW